MQADPYLAVEDMDLRILAANRFDGKVGSQIHDGGACGFDAKSDRLLGNVNSYSATFNSDALIVCQCKKRRAFNGHNRTGVGLNLDNAAFELIHTLRHYLSRRCGRFTIWAISKIRSYLFCKSRHWQAPVRRGDRGSGGGILARKVPDRKRHYCDEGGNAEPNWPSPVE